MRTSKTVTISLPPRQFEQARRLAQAENRTMSELVREALRHYQEQRRQSPGNSINTSLPQALRAVQQEAVLAGLDRLIDEGINEEIAAVRSSAATKARPKSHSRTLHR